MPHDPFCWVDDPAQVKEIRPHTQIRRNSWFLRLYLWVWGAEVSKVTFCRLFWGLGVFLIPALIVRIITLPIVGLIDVISDLAADQQRKRKDDIEAMSIDEVRRETERQKMREQAIVEKRTRRKERRLRRAKRRQAILTHLSAGGDRFVGGVKSAWPYLRYPVFGILIVLAGAGAAAVLYFLYLFVTWPALWASLPTILLWVGIGAFVLVFGVGGSLLFASSEAGASFGQSVNRKGKSVGGFFKVMGHGAKATKYRTCAVVEIVDD